MKTRVWSGIALWGIAALAACLVGLSWVAPVPSAGPLPDLVVDPNTAPPEVLAALPGLGPALVGRITA